MALYDRVYEGTYHLPAVPEVPENLPKELWVSASVQRTYIGASQAAAILGHGYAGQTALTVWEQIVYPENAPKMDEDADYLVMGDLLEKPIAQRYAEKTDCKLWWNDRRIWRHRKYPYIASTPDFACWEEDRLVETKNVSVFAAGEWDDPDDPPLKFQIQGQMQLLTTGMKEVHIVGLLGGNRIEYRVVKRNEKFIRALEKKLVDFWENNVIKKVPPPVTEGSDIQVLQRLHPDDNGKAVNIDVDESLLRRWEKAARIKSKCEKIEAKAKAQVVAALKDNTYGVCGDEFVSFKTQERAGHYVDPSKFRVARRIKNLPKGVSVETDG